MPEVRIDVYADTHGAPGELKKTEDALGGIDRAGGTAHVTLGGLWTQFGLGVIAADYAMKALRFFGSELRSVFTAAMESEDAQRKLQAAIATTGQIVGIVLPDLTRYADTLMEQTVYDDEAIKGAMALGIQLGLTGDEVKEATKAAIGLTSSMGGNLNSNIEIAAKGFQGVYTQLNRMIPAVRMATTDVDKHAAMVKVFGEMYAFAQGETTTFSGSLKTLGIWWGEVKEKIGAAVIENKEVRRTMDEVKKSLMDVAKSEDFTSFLTVVATSLTLIIKLAKEAKTTLDLLGGHGIWKKMQEEGRAAGEAFEKEFALGVDAGTAAIKRANEAGHIFASQIALFGTVVSGVLPPHRDLSGVLDAIGVSYEGASKKKDSFKDNVQKLITVIRTAVKEHRDFNQVVSQAPAAFNDAAYAMQNILLPARELNDVVGKAPGVFQDMAYGAEKAVGETHYYFDGLYNDIARDMGDAMGDLVSEIAKGMDFANGEFWKGGINFKETFKKIFASIKDAFFTMIGEMLTDKVLDLFKSFFSSAAEVGQKAMESAAGTAVGGATDIVKGASGAISGLWLGLGAAVGTFLGTLLGGGGKSNTDVTYWLKMIKDNSQDILNWTIGGITVQLQDYIKAPLDMANGFLDRIAVNTDALKSLKAAAGGFSGVVSQPTMFMAGERGPETINISPRFDIGGGVAPITLVLPNGRVLAQFIAPYMPELSRAGVMKFHKNGLVDY